MPLANSSGASIGSLQRTRFVTRSVEEAVAYFTQGTYRRIRYTHKTDDYRLSIDRSSLDLMSVNRLEASAEISLDSVTDNGRYLLVGVKAGPYEQKWNGNRVSVGVDQGIVLPPNQETSMRRGSCEVSFLSIAQTALSIEIELLTNETMSHPLEVNHAIDLSQNSLLGRQVSFLVDFAMTDRIRILEPNWKDMRLDLQRKLISALIERTPNVYQRILAKLHGGHVAAHVARLEDFLDAHLTKRVTVTDMAHAVGINPRTLRKSCRRKRQKPPEVIWREMRLDAARRRLEHPQPEDAIESVAHLFCFGHEGRFAAYFQDRFGEPPHETLRQGRRKAGI